VLAPLMRLLCVAVLALPVFGAQAGVVLTGLHSFQEFPDGAYPHAALVQGSDGNFYGTTQVGSTNGGGNIGGVGIAGKGDIIYSYYDPDYQEGLDKQTTRQENTKAVSANRRARLERR